MTHQRRKSEDVKAIGRIRLRKNTTALYSVVTMYALIVRKEKERYSISTESHVGGHKGSSANISVNTRKFFYLRFYIIYYFILLREMILLMVT